MRPPEILKTLEGFGTAQTRKIYRRHGVGGPQFGVSYANLKALKKKVKTNHEAALALWQSGNHDARVFATMIADPAKVSLELLHSWADDLDSYVVTDAFVKFAGRTAHAEHLMKIWMDAGQEWKGQAAWSLLAEMALKREQRSDDYFRAYLPVIERNIHLRHNRERHAMNTALIAMGMRSNALEKEALRVAAVIGVVRVDHGETSCKTPDAAAYIGRTKARNQR